MPNRAKNPLLGIGLPKWPQMYTTGKPVTLAQAKEIIRRTDTFFTRLSGGNNHAFDKMVAKKLKVPLFDFHEAEKVDWRELLERQEEFHRRWETIQTEYVHNSWISCSYIGGPHGWCHPNGEIGFVDNVGKWPSVENIRDEWQTLAKEFPFLEIDVTLMDGEYCEAGIKPLVGLKIRNASVTLVDPNQEPLHQDHLKARRGNGFDHLDEDVAFAMRMSEPDAEQGLPISWINEWAEDARRKS